MGTGTRGAPAVVGASVIGVGLIVVVVQYLSSTKIDDLDTFVFETVLHVCPGPVLLRPVAPC